MFNPPKIDPIKRDEKLFLRLAELTEASDRKLRWTAYNDADSLFLERADAFSGYYTVHRGVNGYVYAAYLPLQHNAWNLKSEVFFESGHSTVDIDTLKAHCQEHYDTISMVPGVDRPPTNAQ